MRTLTQDFVYALRMARKSHCGGDRRGGLRFCDSASR
jgi:hypothetical protein